MFNQQEVQILLGGVNSPIDLEDLWKHTNYSRLYNNAEAMITAFWNIRVLHFGCSYGVLMGL
jgi:ubiquitin-protein ligase E3 C